MKNLIKNILKEQIDQRVVDSIYNRLVNLLPIKNGRILIDKFRPDMVSVSIDINNLDDITYFTNKEVVPYLDKIGLTEEEKIYITKKFVYEYAFMEGKGPRPGDTIVLDYTDDPYTQLKKGSKGIFEKYDGLGQLRIRWENGSNLSLIPEVDKFHIIRKK